MVKVLVPTTNLSHRVLMDPSATALVEERAVSSITRSVTMDRDAASSAGWVSPTAHGPPRTGTLMMASELITQEKIDQETRGTTGDHSFLAISNDHWISFYVSETQLLKCFGKLANIYIDVLINCSRSQDH